MKKLSVNVCVLISIILGSCVAEKDTILMATLYNNSGVKVTFMPYSKGIVVSERIINFNNGDSFQIANQSHRGDLEDYGFYSEYISGIDSIIIKFNDSFPVTHYTNVVTDTVIKSYQPTNQRNIFIGANYEFEKIRTKKERTNIHRYRFTESDYEYAKD